MKLLTALRSEMLKTRRTASFYFTVIGAAPIPLIILLNILLGGSDLRSVGADPLNRIFTMGIERNGVLFFPMFVILVCTLMAQIEYRNNTWKQLFASPQTKGDIFLAKFININILLLLFLAASFVYMGISVVVIHFANPGLHMFDHSFQLGRIIMRTGNIYATVLAMCAVQFWLGLRFRNFIVPTALGFGMWVAGMLMSFEMKSKMANYFPYSLQTFPFKDEFNNQMTSVVWTTIAVAAGILLLGFLDFRRRRLAS